MSLVAAATTFTVLMLLASVVLGWIADLKRAGGAVSARESRAAAEGTGRAFYTSREARAEAMRERIRRERTRRERARARTAPTPSGPEPHADRPAARPPTPEDLHRAVLELGTGPVTADDLRRQYRRLVVAYHPDRVAGLGAKLQRLAEEETKAINEAYAFFKARLGRD
ncbi:J domain-containing protein [Rubrivirga sp.]|uniref:J domain-containing protein n=1 Tax=Rubrivirga sp. TaxID=1885344 RepID=UPI003B51DD0D